METLDLAGIGAGPFNLSLAAAMTHAPPRKCAFFERRPAPGWHDGLMLEGARMQTSPLKDLIAPIRPTSPFTFLNYLVETGRFWDFAGARAETVERAEFADYLGWAARRLPSVRFGAPVDLARAAPDGFELIRDGRPFARARALSVAVGTEPRIPRFAAPLIGADCLHASRFLRERPAFSGRRVAVVGGGQTGAEIFLHLLGAAEPPAKTVWIDRRPRISPLEEGAFVDQIFTPGYLERYRGLSVPARSRACAQHRLAADGLTPATLDEIYRLLYRRIHIEGRRETQEVRSGVELAGMRRTGRAFALALEDPETGGREGIEADLVILATGWSRAFPACLAPLKDLLVSDGENGLALDRSYRARWRGAAPGPLFILNRGRDSHGVAEAQMSLAAWRSGVIVNALTGKDVFPLGAGPSLLRWGIRGETAPRGLVSNC